MWTYNTPEELYHWGVLGMKWGHKKSKLEYSKKKQYLEKKEIQTRNKMYDYLYKKHKPKNPYTKQDIYDYSTIDKNFKLLFDEHEKYAKQLDKINREELYHSNTELYHWGILGMKWGHRKTKQTNNIKTKKAETSNETDKQKRKLTKSQKIALGAAIVATLAAGYSGYKLIKGHKEKVANGKKVIDKLKKMSMESEVQKGMSKSYLNQLAGSNHNNYTNTSYGKKIMMIDRAKADSVISNANIIRKTNAKIAEGALKEKTTKKQAKEISKLVRKIKDSGDDAFYDEKIRKSINKMF